MGGVGASPRHLANSVEQAAIEVDRLLDFHFRLELRHSSSTTTAVP